MVVTLIVFAAAGIPNFSAFKTLFSNTDGMRDGYEYVEKTFSLQGLTEFIGEHPEYMSVVSYNVNNPDSGIFYGADIPRTQGAISNFFLVAEYERQVLNGNINPREEVQIEDIEKYFLPQISENAHESSLETLNELSEDGLILDEVVQTMIESNGLALADFVWFKLGEENINNLMDSLSVTTTDDPLPFSGIYISINPEFADTSRTYSDKEIIKFAERFQDDEQYRQQILDSYRENRLNLNFLQERDALSKFPQTTAREMADLMAKLQQNELISETVSEAIKVKMNWTFEGEAIQRSFTKYGAIYDNRMGMLSGIDFGTSKFDGHTSAQAVFFDQLPVAFFIHLSANHMQEDYQQRLIWDPALYETTIKEINRNN